MYLEKSVEQYLRRAIIARGGMAIKLDSEAGLPDRLVVLPGGRNIYVELKRPDGRVSEIQKVMHQRLRNLGQKVYVLWNFEQVDRFVDSCFKDSCFKGGNGNG